MATGISDTQERGLSRPRNRSSDTNARAACAQLGELILHLRQIQSAAIVCAIALKRQNCELDDDIACLLQRSVADRLHEQIEKAETALRLLNRRGRG